MLMSYRIEPRAELLLNRGLNLLALRRELDSLA